MGVRVALGASTPAVVALVLSRSLRQALAGIALGLPAAFLVRRTITALLYGTAPADPRNYAASAAVLLVLAAAAAVVPALRAARVNPVQALGAD